jgi:2,7-dihydroxy-5-methyl-1-naphthoate 7-O-methyltransferase
MPTDAWPHDSISMEAGVPDTDVRDLVRLADLVTPWAIRAAATLRIADEVAAGPADVGQLAHKLDVDAAMLGRLLRYLARIGLYRQEGESLFALTSMGRQLLDDHPVGLRAWLDLDGWGGRQDRAYACILDMVRSGRPAYELLYGCSVWEDLAIKHRLAESFNSMMARQARQVASEILSLFDWSKVRHVVDVGGGIGIILHDVLAAHTQLRGTLVERPETVSVATHTFDSTITRCCLVGQSFFEVLPSGGDVYLLSFVLLDWSDADAIVILRNCARAAKPQGRILIFERIASDNTTTTSRDLCMLAISGGKERTVGELDNLLAEAGLRRTAMRRSPSGRFLVECETSDGGH